MLSFTELCHQATLLERQANIILGFQHPFFEDQKKCCELFTQAAIFWEKAGILPFQQKCVGEAQKIHADLYGEDNSTTINFETAAAQEPAPKRRRRLIKASSLDHFPYTQRLSRRQSTLLEHWSFRREKLYEVPEEEGWRDDDLYEFM